MNNWLDYYAERVLKENAEDLIFKAYHTMSPSDKEKISKVLASPTWGEQWMNLMRTLLNGKDNLPPQQVADIVLDGIDSYLDSKVTKSKGSERIRADQTRRVEPRADYQGNFGKSQTMWGNKDAKHGDVSSAEIKAKGLHQHHPDVYNGPGGLATAPSSYKYVFIRTKNKIVHNPNYQD